MFTPQKIAQMAAYFADRQGGTIDTLKLVKLLYLADRESVARHGSPISYDRMVSMPHGPVLSIALNLVHGDVGGTAAEKWGHWISDSRNHQVSLNRAVDRESLNELSERDLQVLNIVWQKFGHMGKWEIRDYTHRHLPEWQDPNGSSLPIGELDLLRALGKTDDEAESIAGEMREQRELAALLSSL